MSVTIEDIAQYATEPGIYQMKNAHGQILYIGKAKNLRARIRQYFIPGRDSRAMVTRLMKQVTAVEVIVVLTEKEVLILENNLIKQHQSKYNVMLKDDKGHDCRFRFCCSASEPKMKDSRFFLSILPGTHTQIQELKRRWKADSF